MEKLCGLLQRVGDLTGGELIRQVDNYGNAKAIGQVRVATEISLIQIGNTFLKKSRCSDELFAYLQPGREACLYVFRHFHWVPVILGIKYTDDGTKHLASSTWIRGSILQYIVVWPFMAGIAGAVAGGMLFSLVGITEIGVGFGIFSAIGYSWWSAFRLWKDYARVKED
jgi:hypothetical protein